MGATVDKAGALRVIRQTGMLRKADLDAIRKGAAKRCKTRKRAIGAKLKERLH